MLTRSAPSLWIARIDDRAFCAKTAVDSDPLLQLPALAQDEHGHGTRRTVVDTRMIRIFMMITNLLDNARSELATEAGRTMAQEDKLSPVEGIKAASDLLRGAIAAELAADTDHFTRGTASSCSSITGCISRTIATSVRPPGGG